MWCSYVSLLSIPALFIANITRTEKLCGEKLSTVEKTVEQNAHFASGPKQDGRSPDGQNGEIVRWDRNMGTSAWLASFILLMNLSETKFENDRSIFACRQPIQTIYVGSALLITIATISDGLARRTSHLATIFWLWVFKIDFEFLKTQSQRFRPNVVSRPVLSSFSTQLVIVNITGYSNGQKSSPRMHLCYFLAYSSMPEVLAWEGRGKLCCTTRTGSGSMRWMSLKEASI